jgi:hypothetical protein
MTGMLFRLVAVLFLGCAAQAALVRIEVEERSDVLGGKEFGAAGAYERITGKAFFTVDPSLEANRIICDVDKAPRNEKGLVEFSSDIYVLKPRDPARGNGAALYEVSNRGRKGMLAMFNRAGGSLDPRREADFGDGFLMEQGFTLVWLGWQFDIPRQEGLMRLYTPVIGGSITGPVRAEFVVDSRVTRNSLGDRSHIPYPPVNPNDEKLTLTVRDRSDGPRSAIARDRWRIEDGTYVVMPSGFEPGRIYEVVYEAKDPVVVGLGPAAVRDLMSFLKYGGNAVTVLGDHRRYIKQAYGFGVSQSGRFLRTFLYYGFNADERGRRVFDGIMSHVAGGGRGSFNHRFAQPSRDAHPFMNLFYPTDIFPFTDAVQSDPETGLSDGLLVRAEKAGVAPKIFYTNSSYEYYGRAASLIHTTLDGSGDVPPGENTRIYLFAGSQHGPAGFPPVKGNTRHLPNFNDFRWPMRALLLRLHAWAKEGKEPPASRYPTVEAGTLAPLDEVRFPKIPGVAFPTRMHKAYRVDYGPEFRSAGIVSLEPPKVGKPFGMRVPQVDADGNETAGIRMPGIQVPLGTFTGWNLRVEKIGAPDELYSMVGSWIPFARTAAERQKRGDPRLSTEERYKGRGEYLEKVEAAARALAGEGYLLEGDVGMIVERAGKEWGLVVSR